MRALRESLGGQSLIYVAILTTILVVSGGALLAFLEPDVVHPDDVDLDALGLQIEKDYRFYG